MLSTPDAKSSALLQLPSDVQQNICQRLYAVQDLANFALCGRDCRALVNSPALWRNLILKRFGHTEEIQSVDNLSVPQAKAVYACLSRTLVPAISIQAAHLGDRYLMHSHMVNSTFGRVLELRTVCWLDISVSFRGVPPGKYEVCWRMQKLARGIGIASSEVNMTAKAHRVHPADPNKLEDDSLTTHPLRAFESNLPTGNWMDVSGGQVTIKEFCNIDARLWCHSGEWKQHLAWDYVQLVDLNALPSVSPGQKSTLAASANAANKVATFAQDFWSRVSRWPS